MSEENTKTIKISKTFFLNEWKEEKKEIQNIDGID